MKMLVLSILTALAVVCPSQAVKCIDCFYLATDEMTYGNVACKDPVNKYSVPHTECPSGVCAVVMMESYFLVNRTCEPSSCPSYVNFDYAGHKGSKSCCNGDLCNAEYRQVTTSESSTVGVTGTLLLLTAALLLGSQW